MYKNRHDELQKGLRALRRHETAKALPLLRQAVAACPAEHSSDLSRRLYWLAIALRRLGKHTLAVKALSNASELAPRGHIRRAYGHYTNDYGQARSACAEHDDYRAYFTVQVRRYLLTVPGQQFSTQLELDTIMEFIARSWLQVQRSGVLAGFACKQKLAYFKSQRLEFPKLRQTVDVALVLPFVREEYEPLGAKVSSFDSYRRG